MTIREAMTYINGVARFGSHLGLDNIRTLMHRLDDPQQSLRFVHVAGTNGKGSTVSFLSHILMKAGYKTGIYTSPFIERFNERIRIGNREIPDEDLARLTGIVKEKAEEMRQNGQGSPTEFEIITAIAFLYFKEQMCDICVLEVGLGGRLDATNVIEAPLLSVITTISFDHMEYLGDTLEKIAYEKAGIIKKGGKVLIYPQKEESDRVFERVCSERGAVLHRAEMPEKVIQSDLSGTVFLLSGRQYRIRMIGSYQVNNAALAAAAAGLLDQKGLEIPEDAIAAGLLEAGWPGRFELIRRGPEVIIDGAHNEEGIRKLTESLKLYYGDRKFLLVIGILRDKEYGRMLDEILPLAKRVFTTEPPSPRALSAEELQKEVQKRTGVAAEDIGNPLAAYQAALAAAGEDDVIVCCGSLYYIGQIRSFERKEKHD